MQTASWCVLVVDDEALVRRLICTMLERAGFTVVEAGSGAEALNLFQQHRSRINLLLTDIIMPGMAGTELVEIISKMDANIPVLFMSAFCDRLDPRMERFVCIAKPFTNTELIGTVQKALSNAARTGTP
jgi:two-component system cell cycle sensor histidine kinase/response regulator CckA